MGRWGTRSLIRLTETIRDMATRGVKPTLDLAINSRGMCLAQLRAREISILMNTITRLRMPRRRRSNNNYNQKPSTADIIRISTWTPQLTKICCWASLQKNLWAQWRSTLGNCATNCFLKTWTQRSIITTSNYILGCKFSSTRKG